MAGIRLSRLRSLSNSLYSSLKPPSSPLYNSYMTNERIADHHYFRSSSAYVDNYYDKRKTQSTAKFRNTHIKVAASYPLAGTCFHKTNPMSALPSTSSTLGFQSVFPFVSVSPMLRHQSGFLSFSSKADKSTDPAVSAASGGEGVDASNSGSVGSDWVDKVKDAWQSIMDVVGYSGEKAKEASNELKPHVEQLLNTYPYLKDVVVPVGFTLTGTVLAWVVLPRILRRFHNYAIQTSVLPSGSLLGDQVPYEKSFWGALEDPARYLITFMAFSQIGMMVAPSTIASEFLAQAWRGAAILSVVWFLHRWKTNVLAHALATQSLAGIDREKLLTLDKVSSVGLFVIGLMALSEACGVAVQSILTVGGIGGVATAFAAKDILGNLLSGLSMQFSKPFSLGDTIKAGSIEGQVVEMGLTNTTILNSEKFPVLVPNSLFSSQVIVNKSRAQWRAVVTKIPLQIESLDKVSQISDDIKSMLRSNSKVFLGKEAPFCFLSNVDSYYAELTVGCNLRHMSKDELYSAQQDILLQSVQIIRKHGAQLGSASFQGTPTQ
ncbi:Mechanosensitive ion channel protein 1 [Hibiscus syriacus]|uniref:Mechanosensitive ion channel protein 1 n=1 Tax=Hibiscus syriacus TaxID=106335 RepID=A0A6A2ZYA9_HIBSY|nr:mechanosensitive ion channel protein 1, mitochondrial-like isoform X1 [Hibiscus syriacus]KAE8696848.1 Mechanosensitive ion channel protein 1 [Hibiscus syriacus]